MLKIPLTKQFQMMKKYIVTEDLDWKMDIITATELVAIVQCLHIISTHTSNHLTQTLCKLNKKNGFNARLSFILNCAFCLISKQKQKFYAFWLWESVYNIRRARPFQANCNQILTKSHCEQCELQWDIYHDIHQRLALLALKMPVSLTLYLLLIHSSDCF